MTFEQTLKGVNHVAPRSKRVAGRGNGRAQKLRQQYARSAQREARWPGVGVWQERRRGALRGGCLGGSASEQSEEPGEVWAEGGGVA